MSNNPLQNRNNWVILDNLPELRHASGFGKMANNFQRCAVDCQSTTSPRINPLVYIPHEVLKIDQHTTETQIKGFGFIAFPKIEEARKFVQSWRTHKNLLEYAQFGVRVYSWEEYQKIKYLPEKYEKETRQQYFEKRNKLWWLEDKAGVNSFRDQFVLRFRGEQFEETQIYWMDELLKDGRVLVYGGEREKRNRKTMTTLYVRWSPKGGFLVTMHGQGIQLWTGPEFISVHKLQHSHVTHVDFSPCEKYVITCNAPNRKSGRSQEEQKKIDDQTQLIIWDSMTGKMLRTFGFDKIGATIKVRHTGWWPIIQWSHNGDYFAKIDSGKRVGAKAKDYDKITIFGTNDMRKLDKKAHPAPAMFNMSPSPTDDLLSYSTRMNENDAASVTIIHLPSKIHVRAPQVLGFDVAQAHLYWQSEGRFLAIKIGHSESKKQLNIISFHTIGIMAIKKPNLPFTKTQEDLGKVTYVAWEPNGSRFAILHGRKGRTHVSFYTVTENGKPFLSHTLENRKANSVFWAPFGGRCVIAFLERRRTAQLEFIDLKKAELFETKTPLIQEHQGCSEVHWDPSGRYLITASTTPLNSLSSGDDTGYKIWSYQGELLFDHRIRYFYQVFWRPRPNFLNSKNRKQARQILHKLKPKFIEHDKEQTRAHASKRIQINLRKLDDYRKLKNQWNKNSNNIEFERSKLRGNYPSRGKDEDYDITSVEQEIGIEYKKVKISKETLNRILRSDVVDFDNLDSQGNEIMQPGAHPQQHFYN